MAEMADEAASVGAPVRFWADGERARALRRYQGMVDKIEGDRQSGGGVYGGKHFIC